MPRKRKTYPTRTPAQNQQPPQVPTGRPYGERQQLQSAQQALPLGRSPSPSPAGGPSQAPPAGGGGPTGGDDLEQRAMQELLQQRPLGIGDPTQRPEEPITAGISDGGQGITSYATQDAARIRRYLPTLEFVADLPQTSESTRNLVRLLRSRYGGTQQGQR